MVSLVCTLRHHTDEVSCCAFSPTLLATSSGDKTLRVYGTADFSELPFSPLSGHSYGVHCCCFSSCGSYLVSCSTDGSTMAWSSHTDSSLLLAGASDGTVALWDFPSKTLRRYSVKASVVACCFSPCGQMFVTGCTYGDLKLWDVDISLLCAEKDAHDLGVACCSFAPQFKVGEFGVFRGSLHSNHLLHTLTSQSAPVLSCAFSADGDLVVSGFTLSYTPFTFLLLCRYVTAVALSPTMPWIATGSMDRTVNLPGHSRLLLLADWSEENVQTWLCEEGLEELVNIFKANNIDGPELSQLNKETAAELGIESVGLRGRLLRNIEALKAEQSGSEAPDEFLCPITRELMKDPVIAADGYSYERESIESWIRGKNKTSPMTNLPLQTTLLTPNRSLKAAITRWNLQCKPRYSN
uniref:WD repeat, SAM and U-box domain-containing protein 1 n=1 Tax=Monopterus albus TaxID=43700 RepID=A0A3Q3JQD0_MONAL